MPSALGATKEECIHSIHGLVPQCPRCRGAMEPRDAASAPTLVCCECHFPMSLRNGIWLALPVERATYFSRFISDYSMIRAAEGRGSLTSEYYLGLPYKDHSNNNKAQWKIRARTYSFLKKKILPALKTTVGGRSRILDMGAGNGWMSYRLTQMGARAVAVDLLVNEQDGLGAVKHYREQLPELFPCFQSESSRLPFADGQFDAVIFNASFHYAESYTTCLREALRCLRKGGMIIVADSPWYSRASNGEQMLAERRAAFLHRFGTLSNSIPSMEFLTDERLSELEETFGIQWERHAPFYGIGWGLRPLIARLRRRREPAVFRIYTARKNA
jgi:SAM-dependent methyltransferase